MNLKRLEIAGFKSFASRVGIEFEPGVTAIVGPNGSGKSNIAESIRWVLGEQKTSALRLQKSEDLIFNGTPKRPKASMAEVSVLLDNSAGKIPIEYSEVEITRKLYRSGETAYLLNGRRAKLATIQELLAKAGFGQDSYTVIGQGAIERLLLGGPADRAQLFEQASGVRPHELQKIAATKKLEATRQNITRVEDIIRELAPNQALLKRQTELTTRKQALSKELDTKRLAYASTATKRLDQQRADSAKQQESTEKALDISKKELAKLRDELKILQVGVHSTQFDKQAAQLKKLEEKRAELQAKLLQYQASTSLLEQEVASLEPAVKQDGVVAQEIKKQTLNLGRSQAILQRYSEKIESFESSIAKLNEKLFAMSAKLKTAKSALAKSQKKEYLHHAAGLIQVVMEEVKREVDPEKVSLAMFKLHRMIRLALEDNAAQAILDVGKHQNDIAKIMAAREEIVDAQTHEVIRVRAIELDIAALETDLGRLKVEQKESAQQLKDSQNKQRQLEAGKAKMVATQKAVAEIERAIELARTELYDFNRQSQASTEQQQELMTKIEDQIVRKSELEHALGQHKTSLQQTTTEIKNLKALRHKWFGSQKLSTGSSANANVSLSDVDHLETELNLLDQIDPEILEEAQVGHERLKFLEVQKNDLLTATADLEKLVNQLGSEIQKQFNSGLAKINTAFGSYFEQFFGGGSATIELRSSEDGTAEIEFAVTPPHKRSHSLAALSGGEKALTSLALLAAIIKTNPSPFVVLDEVDAAFDDSNSRVFTRALAGLSKRSQIIIITHNHETMQASQNLLGVTTQGSGDSMIVPLSLRQAEVELVG